MGCKLCCLVDEDDKKADVDFFTGVDTPDNSKPKQKLVFKSRNNAIGGTDDGINFPEGGSDQTHLVPNTTQEIESKFEANEKIIFKRAENQTPIISNMLEINKELSVKREKLIFDFYTDVLIEAEKRVGPFLEDNIKLMDGSFRYGVSTSELLAIKSDKSLKYVELLIINDNTIYWGQLNSKGVKEGFGTLLQRGGIRTDAYWKKDQISIYGRHITKEGLVCEGKFVKGKLHGLGLENSSLYVYAGEFDNGIKHGEGVYTSEKEKYTGTYSKGKRHGKGILEFKDKGNVYKGDFFNGSLQGDGEFTWATKDCYTGQFLANKMHGVGIYRWTNGEVYEGEYVSGKKSGKGTMKWKDGKIYTGLFENNEPKK